MSRFERSRFCVSRAVCASLASAAIALTAGARSADAQVLQRFALRGEAGVGTMLSADQMSRQGYMLAVQGSGRLGFSIIDPLAVEVGFSSWFFPSGQGDGQALLPNLGLRFEPRLGRVARLELDAHAQVALTGLALPTGVLTRFGFDVGLGVEFLPTAWLGVGPMLRYSHIVAAQGTDVSDAMFWSGGVALSLRIPPPPPPPPPPPVVEPTRPPPDTDADGVLDSDDLCVTEPQGERPDPERRGCPIRDTDRDGVLDVDDRCIATPQGPTPDPERRGCPDGDEDADGVRNQLDQCRTVAQGNRPDPSRAGCPLPDRDGDTVFDDVDRCPDQPGAPSSDPARNGCPGLVRVQNGFLQITSPVFFATNRDRILPRSFPVLTAVADTLRANQEIRRVSVEGHTDDVGDDTRNQGLSSRRAESVRRWLAEHGVDASRLEAHGFGESRPLRAVTGVRGRALRDARAQNRRVEFRILDGAGSAVGQQ
ncbi:MAG: OmpA family protein [Myxococcales bacterium]|nr:OmpA family protein [Myxococcales bacterium]